MFMLPQGSENFDLWHHMDNGRLWYYILKIFMNVLPTVVNSKNVV
jgi:hypothetical protein